MRLSTPVLVLALGLAAPAAQAGDTPIASDLNAAFTVATLDNAPALGLEPGPRFGARLRYDGTAFQGFPFAISTDLAFYGPVDLWESSVSLGLGYWLGPVSLGLLGGVGLERGGKDPLQAPVLFTLNLQATAAVNLGDMLRLRVWAKPTWLSAVVQGNEGDIPVSALEDFDPLLTIAGHRSDELNLGAALALTLPRHGPANHLFNGSATFWAGAEYRSLLRNKMVGFFIGYGAATGAYNGSAP
jgi:hypothetical protein